MLTTFGSSDVAKYQITQNLSFTVEDRRSKTFGMKWEVVPDCKAYQNTDLINPEMGNHMETRLIFDNQLPEIRV